MLHRLALRVIPQLSAAVTEREVRKRKRLVMLAHGEADLTPKCHLVIYKSEYFFEE